MLFLEGLKKLKVVVSSHPYVLCCGFISYSLTSLLNCCSICDPKRRNWLIEYLNLHASTSLHLNYIETQAKHSDYVEPFFIEDW